MPMAYVYLHLAHLEFSDVNATQAMKEMDMIALVLHHYNITF